MGALVSLQCQRLRFRKLSPHFQEREEVRRSVSVRMIAEIRIDYGNTPFDFSQFFDPSRELALRIFVVAPVILAESVPPDVGVSVGSKYKFWIWHVVVTNNGRHVTAFKHAPRFNSIPRGVTKFDSKMELVRYELEA